MASDSSADKRIADYFVIAGLDRRKEIQEPFEHVVSQENIGSRKDNQGMAPIVDLTVVMRSEGELVPPGWSCIEYTPLGFPADLNHGSLHSPQIFICFRRGYDLPPLVDIGVLYEAKERVMPDSDVVHSTPYGRIANVNNSKSRTFLTYRRAHENSPCNQLVVTDICVILTNKGETPPHAYCLIPKNLNKGMVGSDVYLCYKKSMNRPPLKCFKPRILFRYPFTDHEHFALPESVPLFCLPMGATVECWPKKCPHPKPVFSTFVLTSDSAEKVYGAAISFYEEVPATMLSREELNDLNFETEEPESTNQKSLYAIKSICLLSRWPFFDTFERYLRFLYRTQIQSIRNPTKIPLELYISHFMNDLPFPSPQRPKILVQLSATTDDTVLIQQPPEYLPLPLSGASFTQLLRNLGPENCLNVLIFGLTEQKILLHSLRPDVLTSVSEAVISMIFPFHWMCPYIPLCPLTLCDVLCAPLPFIVGVDSRYFDLYEPPIDVVCIDLDTNSIYLSEQKRQLNAKLFPKKPARVLKNTLETLFEKINRPSRTSTYIQVTTKSKSSNATFENPNLTRKNFERKMDLEIQEAFIRFMASILKNFRNYFLPITRAPTVGATDPTALFDFAGFLRSRDKNDQKFFQLLMRTQMFTRFIEERTFVSDKDASLAFFDDCAEKVEANDISSSSSITTSSLLASVLTSSSSPLKLLDIDDELQSDRTVFIPPPEPPNNVPNEGYSYPYFDSLNLNLFHSNIVKKLSLFTESDSSRLGSTSNLPTSPMAKRTKQEVRAAQRAAKKHAESPFTWAKCLVGNCYSLWFTHLPAHIKSTQNHIPKGKTLRVAFQVLIRMQELNLYPPDEVCYRVLMLLCGLYSQPMLAVKIFFQMKQNGVVPNAITYGYYSKAVLESKWPESDVKATLMWNKLRNVISGVSHFKQSGRIYAQKRLESIQERDPLSPSPNSASEGILGAENQPSTSPQTNSIQDNQTDIPQAQEKGLLENQPSQETEIVCRHPKKFQRTLSEIVVKNHQVVSLPFAKVESQDAENELQDPPISKSQTTDAIKERVTPEKRKLQQSKSLDETDTRQSPSPSQPTPLIDTTNPMKESPNLLPVCTEEEVDPASISPPEEKEQLMKDVRILNGSADDQEETNAGESEILRSQQEHVRSKTPESQDFLSTFSPFKDAMMKMELFSPEGKVASTFRSSFRLASKFAAKAGVTPSKPTTLARSSTFHGPDDQNEVPSRSSGKMNKLASGSLSKRESTQSEDALDASCPTHLPRSATLPNPPQKQDSLDSRLDLSDDTASQASGSQDTSTLSLWQNKIGSSKHSEYVYTTIKSAAKTMASRLDELKTSLATSGSSHTPSKFQGLSNQASQYGQVPNSGNVQSLWNQLANPWANFKLSDRSYLDEDDYSSNDEYDFRRSSLASDDEYLQDRSREGSIGPGYSAQISRLFEVLSNHYNTPLDQHVFNNRLKTILHIKMTSCSRCHSCTALVFDENLMDGWTADDSNLNTTCSYCATKFVPLLTISIEDLRETISEETSSLISLSSAGDQDPTEQSQSKSKSETQDVSDNSSEQKSKQQEVNQRKEQDIKEKDPESSVGGKIRTLEPFTVPYLSPLVLRKEIENVLDSEGDVCLTSHDFVDNHPICYWNLVWYTRRVNLPTHLPGLLLNSRTLNQGREVPEAWKKYDYRNVSLFTFWENEHLDKGSQDAIYKIWADSYEKEPRDNEQGILDESGRINRTTMIEIINCIQKNDLTTPMKILLEARRLLMDRTDLPQATPRSIYRDLIFFSFVSLGRENIDLTAFDREYRRSFEAMSPREQALIFPVDRPPSTSSIYCRRSFKELDINARTRLFDEVFTEDKPRSSVSTNNSDSQRASTSDLASQFTSEPLTQLQQQVVNEVANSAS